MFILFFCPEEVVSLAVGLVGIGLADGSDSALRNVDVPHTVSYDAFGLLPSIDGPGIMECDEPDVTMTSSFGPSSVGSEY